MRKNQSRTSFDLNEKNLSKTVPISSCFAGNMYITHCCIHQHNQNSVYRSVNFGDVNLLDLQIKGLHEKNSSKIRKHWLHMLIEYLFVWLLRFLIYAFISLQEEISTWRNNYQIGLYWYSSKGEINLKQLSCKNIYYASFLCCFESIFCNILTYMYSI